jgi:hypothetical protein
LQEPVEWDVGDGFIAESLVTKIDGNREVTIVDFAERSSTTSSRSAV